jgi:hypothetical protein
MPQNRKEIRREVIHQSEERTAFWLWGEDMSLKVDCRTGKNLSILICVGSLTASQAIPYEAMPRDVITWVKLGGTGKRSPAGSKMICWLLSISNQLSRDFLYLVQVAWADLNLTVDHVRETMAKLNHDPM